MYMGQVIAGRFELGRPFESSADTEVFLARDRKRNQLVIAKILQDTTSREADILMQLHHEGIIRPLHKLCLAKARGFNRMMVTNRLKV